MHNEKLHDTQFSPNIIRTLKLRRMRWVDTTAEKGGGIQEFCEETWSNERSWKK